MRYRDIIEHAKSPADANTKREQARREQSRQNNANDRLKAANTDSTEALRRFNQDIQQATSPDTAQTDRAEALRRFQKVRAAADRASKAAKRRLRGDK